MGSPIASQTKEHTLRMARPDPYADFDFDEVTEATGLAHDEIKCLKVCFDLFDTKKQDYLSADELDEIMRSMGFRPSKEELRNSLRKSTRMVRDRSSSLNSVSCAPPSWLRTPTLKP